MDSGSKKISEVYQINKDNLAILNEELIGPKRQQLIKWINTLIEKPKNAPKEEEKLKGLEVEASVISEIQKGDQEFRMKYFNQIFENILVDFKSKQVKEGNLYVRSQILKRWKERKIAVDEGQKQFIIYSGNKIKTLSLATYKVNWIGKKKDYQVFSLDSMSPENKYKQFQIGWVNQEGSRVWFDAIQNIINSLPQTNENNQSLFKDSLIQSSIAASNAPDSQKNQDEEYEKAEKPKESLQLNVSKSKKDETQSKKSTIQNISSSDSSDDESEEVVNQPNQPKKQSQTDKKKISSPIKNPSQGKIQNSGSPSKNENNNLQKNLNISSNQKEEVNRSDNKKTLQREAENKGKQGSSQKEQRKPGQSNISNLEKEVEQNLERLDELQTPQVIQEVLSEYNLNQIKDERDYKTISFTHGMRLLQNTEDPRRFKVFIAFQGVSSFEIFNCISHIDDYYKWNSNVAETKVLNIMKNEQAAIIYQKNKGIGIMYRPRDFVYLRHAFAKDQHYYIVDKSIEYDSIPGSISIVRGEIEYAIWCCETHPQDQGRSLLIAEFCYNNSGQTNVDQDASITYAFLSPFQNLAGFIAQKSFQKSISVNMFDISDQSKDSKNQVRNNNKQDQGGNRQNLSESNSKQSISNSQQVFDSSPISSNNNQKSQSDKKNQGSMPKLEDVQEVQQPSSTNAFSKSSLEQLEDEEKRDVRIAYEQDEIQNKQLNKELRKFSEEIHQQEIDASEQVQNALLNRQSYTIDKCPGDKLSNMTIPEIIELVNKNKHWGICVDQKYSMGRIQCEEKRLSSDPEKGHYQFKKDWERCLKTGKFLFQNKEKIDTQKKVISFLLTKIGSNILSGKSITSISLPIDIFEPRSNIERVAYSCSFAPVYLKRAAELTDPLEQMKNCAMYLITTTIMYLDLEKPFNPILGETYQGRLDGYPFYCEQISHHPPICAFQYYADTYQLTGTLESIAQMHANSITGINQGNVVIKFPKTGNEVGILQAPGSLNGTAFGTRYMSVDGKYLAYDIKNKLVLEIKVNPDKKGFFNSGGCTMDYMAGGIYRVNDKFVKKFEALKPHYYKFQGLNMKEDVVEQLSTINGYWNLEVFVDNQKWFDIEDPLPFKLEHEINPLASDCNYRQDILYLKDKNKKDGQEYKELLENYQRADRKLREKQHEIRKKNLKNKKK